MEFTEKQKKIHEELCKQFDDVMVYNGDDQLISSINAEYHFDPEDMIMTDGCIAPSMHPYFSDYMCDGVEYEIGIRGATYLIIHKTTKNKTTLRIDKPFIVEKHDAIIAAKFQLDRALESIRFYMNEWRSTPLSNPCPIGSIME